MAVLGPTNLVVTVKSSTVIDMLWDNRNGPYGAIEVWEKRATGDYAKIDTIPGSKEYYKSDNLDPSTAYCYKVRGIFYPAGQTAFCTEDCDTTTADFEDPTDIVVTPISGIEAEVVFKDNSADETTHRLERQLDTEGWLYIVDLEPNREFFRDGGLFLLEAGYTDCVPGDIGKQVHDDVGAIGPLIAYDNTRRRWLIDSNGHTIADAESMTISGGEGIGTAARAMTSLIKARNYTYRVRVAVSGEPVQDWVTASQITTLDVPGIPTLAVILAADIKDKSIRIRWTNVANETGYRIEKSDDDSFEADEGELIAVVGAGITDFLITGLTPGTPYWFRVRAYNAAGYSAYSDVRTSTTDDPYEPTEFEKWIRNPNIEPVYLAELNLKMNLSGFTLIAEKTHIYGYNEKLLDGGLNLWDDETHLTKWSENIAGTSTVNREATEAHKVEGDFSCRLDIDGDNNIATIGQGKSFIPNKKYKIVVWYKNSEAGKTGRLMIVNTGANVWLHSDGTWGVEVCIVLPNSTIWKRYELEFYGHPDYSNYQVVFQNWSAASSSIYFDNLSIEEFPIFQPEREVEFDNIWENGNALTKKTSIVTVEATAGTWWWDTVARKLYVHSSTGADPDGFLIEGGFWMYISNKKNIEFNGNFYLPLLSKEDIPDITQEIKPYFEGSFGISSGSIAFANAEIGGEHFFDKRFATYTWINAKVILKAGKDDFIYGDFKEIFTAYIDSKSCNDKKITFQLRDIREEMRTKIALNKFTMANYPGLESRFKDKSIPVYLGTNELVTPACIDEDDEKFKCNDGRIKSVDRVFKNGVELFEDIHYFVDLQRAIITFNRDGKFIIDATNKKINFKEAAGELTATLIEKTYTTAELLVQIKSKLDAEGTLTYTVTCPSATKRFKITATGSFSLLWRTGTNGLEGTDTHVGTTIGFHDDEDDTDNDSHEANIDVISIHRDDIIGVQLQGLVNSADEVIKNGAEIFKYLMNTYKGLADSELNLDSIYEAKYASGAYDSSESVDKALAVPLDKEKSFDEIIRSIEHSIESYTFQDEFGRLGIRPQQTVVASNAKYIVSTHIFGHSQKKDKSSLYWKVTIFYNKDHEDNYEETTATSNAINWKYGVEEVLDIYTYFSTPAHASALATSILNLLNKEQIDSSLSMLLFDVMAGDLIKFSRVRFYDLDGTVEEGSEITLRVLRISKSPASGRTSIITEVA